VPHPDDPNPHARPDPPAAPREQERDERTRSFLRMASHELRTPLNSIIGFADIIARELYGPINDPRYREHAELVRESGMKMLKLVNQVVEIARLQAGAADLHLHPEAVLSLVEEAVAAFEYEAEGRNVAIRIDAAPDLPPALVDQRALKTAVSNLVQNAVTFAPDGTEIAVTLALRKDWLCIAVRDHGPGVDPAELPRLMRPFEQGEAPLIRRSEGAGLGLPIVRLLCQAMNGGLRLQSEPGAGFLATIRLRPAPGADADPDTRGFAPTA